jgi:hypothetical protein
MPYKNPKQDRDYTTEYKLQQKRDENPARAERAAARRAMDAAGINRDGKDIDHKVPLSKGGTNAKSNLRIVAPAQNRSFDRNSDHSVRINKPMKRAK